MQTHRSSQNLFQRCPVATFYILTLFISWLVFLALGAVKQGWIDLQIPFALHYLAAFGPMLSAVIVTGMSEGRAGLVELWGRITKWRVGWRWFLFSTASPAAAFAAALPIVRLVKGEWPDLRLLGQANYLPYLGAGVLVVWLASYGFGEEIGWRGFALPRLQRTYSTSKATLILALMWAVWHAPAFLYLETFEKAGLIVMPGFIVGVLFAAVMFTWIYNGTGGSVLMVAIWHALIDFFMASKAGQDVIPFVMTVFVIGAALLVANVERPWGFRFQAKHQVGGTPVGEGV